MALYLELYINGNFNSCTCNAVHIITIDSENKVSYNAQILTFYTPPHLEFNFGLCLRNRPETEVDWVDLYIAGQKR